jgi:ABC-type lipoprotein export system ATPase subunit
MIEWYSTGSFYLAKNLVEILPTLICSVSYSLVVYYFSGQLLEQKRLLGYVYIITISMLCIQGLGYLIGIIFIEYEQIAMVIAIGLQLNLIFFCNYFILVKDMPKLFQLISEIFYLKYTFNSGLIAIYGFDRCSSDELSIIFYRFGLSDEQFWPNAQYLMIYFIALRILAFIALYIKTNTFFNRSKPKKITEDLINSIKFNENVKQESQYNEKRIASAMSNRSDNNMHIKNCLELKINSDSNKKLSIAWIDLTLRIEKNMFRKEKIILNQLNGCVEFGSLNALMGPSGAGKTSLLRCLSGRYQTLLTDETRIYLSKFEKIRTCFISQDEREHLLEGLTAKQILIYASKLKNSDKRLDHEMNVKNLMTEFLISDIEDNCVQNCSGGEQKRLAIALELTSQIKPNLICIDEPTSGLDSNAAEVVGFVNNIFL